MLSLGELTLKNLINQDYKAFRAIEKLLQMSQREMHGEHGQDVLPCKVCIEKFWAKVKNIKNRKKDCPLFPVDIIGFSMK